MLQVDCYMLESKYRSSLFQSPRILSPHKFLNMILRIFGLRVQGVGVAGMLGSPQLIRYNSILAAWLHTSQVLEDLEVSLRDSIQMGSVGPWHLR